MICMHIRMPTYFIYLQCPCHRCLLEMSAAWVIGDARLQDTIQGACRGPEDLKYQFWG